MGCWNGQIEGRARGSESRRGSLGVALEILARQVLGTSRSGKETWKKQVRSSVSPQVFSCQAGGRTPDAPFSISITWWHSLRAELHLDTIDPHRPAYYTRKHLALMQPAMAPHQRQVEQVRPDSWNPINAKRYNLLGCTIAPTFLALLGPVHFNLAKWKEKIRLSFAQQIEVKWFYFSFNAIQEELPDS